jgi:D-alanyl-D-alanine carboxypeptidase
VTGDVVTAAFAAEGFGWGGDYTSLKDYQHFERAP